MTKILLRAGFSPLDSPQADQIILENLIWENTGNMLFPYSIMRILMREDTKITAISVNRFFSAAQAAEWSREYNCFVIPLANAFRDSFLIQLKYLTALIKKLTIPCIVIGVGIQTGTSGIKETTQGFDRTVSEFVKAVLKKSSLLGVRGEFTAQYLKQLGFAEEKDFTVIGCSSMYLHGRELPYRAVNELNERSPVSVNCKIQISAKLNRFIFSSAKQFQHYTYVPQGIDDLLLLYAGVSVDREKFPRINKGYPWQLHSRICASGHETGFTDVRSWLEFLKGVDFSFGTRIHGNIAAVLAGTPAFIFVPDGRILELARYHNIQHILAEDIKEDTDIFTIYENADFSSVQQGHAQRFEHYLSFLEKNGLSHIYMDGDPYGVSPFDKIMERIPLAGPFMPLHKIPLKEQTVRLQTYYAFLKQMTQKHVSGMQKEKSLVALLPEPVRERMKQLFIRYMT